MNKWRLAIAASLSLATAAGLASVLVGKPASCPSIALSPAIIYAKEHGLTGHVMNAYYFGGPLILEGIPTFIDGRTEQLFQDGFSLKYQEMLQQGGRRIFVSALDDYDIQWTLFQPSDPRNGYLDTMPNWKRVFADDVAVIYKKLDDVGG